MKRFLLLLFCTFSFKASSQSNEALYIIPDSVEIAIKGQILKSNSTKPIHFLLEKDVDNVYSLSLFRGPIDKKSLQARIINGSNRFLLIDKVKYPLMFDYDFQFGTPDDQQIGSLGKREGNVVRSHILFHGYTIYFNRVGKIIKQSFY